MKKVIIFVCLILFVISFFLLNKKEETGYITFATWGSASEISILKPIIADFEKKEGIKVQLMHIPQNYFQKLHLLFASNLAPDVIFINNIHLPLYVDYLLPLNTNRAKYYPQILDSMSYNNNLYAIPRDVSNLVIFYNKDLFDKYHLSYPKSDWTINDLLNYAQKLTQNNTYGISYESKVSYLIPYLFAFNEEVYPLENIPNSKGLQFYNDLINKYHVAPTKSDVGSKTVAQLFIEGRLAMHLSGRWLVPKYTETINFRWGIINFPAPVACDSSGWAISKSSIHKNEALKFIKFLSQKENIQKMTQSGLIVPARVDVNFQDEVFKNVIKMSKPVIYSTDFNKKTGKLNDTIFLNNP